MSSQVQIWEQAYNVIQRMNTIIDTLRSGQYIDKPTGQLVQITSTQQSQMVTLIKNLRDQAVTLLNSL